MVFAVGFYWILNGTYTCAQPAPKNLTLLYSNNLNGEIHPCPT